MTNAAGKKAVPGAEGANVPLDYQLWAWRILHPQMQDLVAFGAKYARSWIVKHRRAAHVPELVARDQLCGEGQVSKSLAEDQLSKCATALATDAFLAIYFHRHPLKRGIDPKAHLISAAVTM